MLNLVRNVNVICGDDDDDVIMNNELHKGITGRAQGSHMLENMATRLPFIIE